MNTLYKAIDKVVEKNKLRFEINIEITREMSEKIYVIPPHRTRYLSEILKVTVITMKRFDPRSSKLYGVFKTQKQFQEKFLLSQNQELMMPLYCPRY
jgi:methylmalonyl-CoA mutase